MRIARIHKFDDVTGIELGYAVIGAPFMTVHAYAVGGLAIDGGLAHQRAVAVDFFKQQRTRTLLLTHHHEDHSANAAAIAAATGCAVCGNPITAQWMQKKFAIRFYRHMVWGSIQPVVVLPLAEVIEGDGVKLLPIATPGHSPDHVVYLEPDRGWLFAGDLFLAERVKYFRSDENLNQQIASLQRVLERDFDALLCSHHPVASGGQQRLRAKLDFMVNFRGQVRALASRGLTTRAIARELKLRETWFVRIWTAGDVSLDHMVRAALAEDSP